MSSTSENNENSTNEISAQEFLDKHQYTESNIKHYEIIFGKQFVSTGGKATTKTFTELLDLKHGESVLDFGSGLGGSVSYMASIYGVKALGIDVSKNMIMRATRYLDDMDEDVRKNVEYKLCNGNNQDFPENSFDCIYSREVIIYIEDKLSLFKKFYKWLKPGGRLLISDYCLGNKDSLSEDFIYYTSSRKYFMQPISEYEILLKSAGFPQVKATDFTQDCIKILENDAKLLYVNKSSILSSITRIEYDKIVSSWDLKLERFNNGEQNYGLFIAKK